MADLQQTIGAVIRRARRERRLTLKALSERAAVSFVYLGEIERGQKYPSALVLEQLARALDLDISELLEMIAADLRGAAAASCTEAIGIAVPAPAPVLSRTPDTGTNGLVDPGLRLIAA